MINFNLSAFMFAVWAIRQLRVEYAPHLNSDEQTPLSDAEKNHLTGILKFAHEQCVRLGLQSPEHRFERMFTDLRTIPQVNHAWAVVELGTLIEAVEDDSKFERFYHYPHHKGMMLLRIPGDWAATLAGSAFPSASKEVEEGVDCYALEHNTACVFHMMRVAEHGLRALARSLKVSFPKTGKPLEWAQWQDLIDQVSAEGKKQANAQPIGPKRDAARDFYSGAVHHFEGFKDRYRNAVMHVRASYDELDALRTINQVRDFMNGLSAKIGEKTKTPIRRWP
jgi:hypothetical protein